jgi:lipopolysaccharide transport system ATP-binding protein
MKPIIEVQNLAKQYRIGAARPQYMTLRESLMNAVRLPFKRRNGSHSRTEMIWAVKDVSFKVAPGDVLGIIGRNGAGKSTLLKMLSRITEPTEGRIKLYGRSSWHRVSPGAHRPREYLSQWRYPRDEARRNSQKV